MASSSALEHTRRIAIAGLEDTGMFDDPQVVIGMVIGVVVVATGTTLGVLGHLRRERAASGEAGEKRRKGPASS